jgi:hypothetical protein
MLVCGKEYYIIAPEGMAEQLCYFVCFFTLFVTHFAHNVAATVSYDLLELLDI